MSLLSLVPVSSNKAYLLLDKFTVSASCNNVFEIIRPFSEPRDGNIVIAVTAYTNSFMFHNIIKLLNNAIKFNLSQCIQYAYV